MFGSPRFTPEEQKIIDLCQYPEGVQAYINLFIPYKTNEEGQVKTFRGVVREKSAQCLEGALFAAAVMRQHGYPPQLLCMERSTTDHCCAVYRESSGTVWWGGIHRPNEESLMHPLYPDLASLASEFHSDKSIRGFTHVDLSTVKYNWQTGDNAACVDDLLYRVPYLSLQDNEGEFYLSDYDGRVTWLTKREMAGLRKQYKGILKLKDKDFYDQQRQKSLHTLALKN